MSANIYRRTRRNWPGTYYQRLTDKQTLRVVARWRQRERKGSLLGCEYSQLMQHLANPDWPFWRVVIRIRNADGLREVATVEVLPPSLTFRQVKRKPQPIKGQL